MDSINYQFHVFAGYILFPMRLAVLVTSSLLIIGSVSLLDSIGCKSLGKELFLLYTKFSIKLFVLTIHSEGLDHLTDKPCIIVGNHINMYDHYIMTNTLNKLPPYIASNKFNIRPINIIFNFMKCIYTENKKGYVVEKMKERIKEGGQITIYPDGCNPIPEGKLIAPFRNGAFVPKAPILPIVIRYVPSSNTNMNWYTDTISNTPFSLLKSYLLDGDIHVYVKVLPLQHYKDSYKSHEEYRDVIYDLMTHELSTLPEQVPTIVVGKPSSKVTMLCLNVIMSVALVSHCIGNTLCASLLFMNSIAGYFCHFYPTKNTQLLDMVSISYTITKTTFMSIQGQYDIYFRLLCYLFILTRIPIYLQYKDEIPFPEKKHIKNVWIPGYMVSLYSLLVNTLELYNYL